MLHPSFSHWVKVNEDGTIGVADYSYLFSYGGRGGGKTEFMGEFFALLGTQRPTKL